MSAPARTDRNGAWIGLAAVAALAFAVGLYAVALNELFYARYGPFYDSMSYANTLARMVSRAKATGMVGALTGALWQTTVAYPWIVLAPFAGLLSPSRSIGVWIQVVTAGAMQFALLYYFLRVRRMPLLQAFIFSGAFVLITAAFRFNGGIADFRMDLLQYLLLAAAMAVYLIARQSEGLGWWIALGTVAGTLCLARATTPVYLVPIFAILAAADLIGATGRRQAVLLRWLIVAAGVAIVAGWFYVANYRLLHHYYFVWNPDANARLPLAISRQHLTFAFRHIGLFMMIALTIACTFTLKFAVGALGRGAIRRLNWRPLVFSAVPLGYLVLSGAGLNPYVSIVGSAGIIMFLLDPIDGERPPWRPAATAVALVALTAGGLATAAAGIRNHTSERAVSSWVPRQHGLRQMVEAVTDAIHTDGRSREFKYAVLHVGSVSGPTVFNTLVYDHRLPPHGSAVGIGNARLVSARSQFGIATDVERKKFGNDDSGRIAVFVSRLEERADFAIIPTADTELPGNERIHAFVPEITRRMLASGRWTPLTQPVVISAIERVVVLRNDRRMPPAPAKQP